MKLASQVWTSSWLPKADRLGLTHQPRGLWGPARKVFSCPGSSIPILGRHSSVTDWLTATLEFGHKEWLETLQRFDQIGSRWKDEKLKRQIDKKTRRHEDKKTKTQKDKKKKRQKDKNTLTNLPIYAKVPPTAQVHGADYGDDEVRDGQEHHCPLGIYGGEEAFKNKTLQMAKYQCLLELYGPDVGDKRSF